MLDCAVDSGEFRTTLEQALSRRHGRPRHIEWLGHRPYPYSSSYPLEELDLVLDDATRLTLILKDMSRAAEGVPGRTKPAFLFDPGREIAVYEEILDRECLGTAAYFGSSVDPQVDRCWLFLEKVHGRELYQVGEFHLWEAAARWLAGLHARFARAGTEDAARWPDGLIHYDRDFYSRWIQRAVESAGRADAPWTEVDRRRLQWLAGRYDRVVDRLSALPSTFIHGEFFASNVLVADDGDGVRVCPVDWEMAAVGPGLVDLAALIAGDWPEARREGLIGAYRDALAAAGIPRTGLDELYEALDHCRLHLAVQWLGWSVGWQAPPEHRHDWLGEALHLAESLSL